MHLLPSIDIDWSDKKQTRHVDQKVVLELKGTCFTSFRFSICKCCNLIIHLGNPYPRIFPDSTYNKNLLHNILLSEVSKDYYKQKTAQEEERSDKDVSEVD